MARKVLMGSMALCVVAALAGAALGETVKGTVYAAGRDEAGAVNAVVIDTPGDSYAVAQDAVGSQLTALENRTVEATGTVSKDEFSNQVIAVTSCRVVE